MILRLFSYQGLKVLIQTEKKAFGEVPGFEAGQGKPALPSLPLQ